MACHGKPPITADDIESTPVERKESDAEAPVEVLLARVEYTLDGAGGFKRVRTLRYRILTERGVSSWGASEVRWSPWYMKRPQLSATVTSSTGEVSKLDPSTISEAAAYPNAPDIYSDGRVLRAPLPSVAVGATVEEVVIDQTKRPFFGGAYTHYEVVQASYPRKKVEIVIDAPEDLALKHELRDAEIAVDDKRAGGRRRLTFSGGPYKAIEPNEPMVASDVPVLPYIVFSTGQSWQQLAKHYGERVKQSVEAEQLGDRAAKLVNDSDSDQVKAEKLLKWLRSQVRYAGIEFGESAIIPRHPQKTLERGYGDCKDQATLLVALLRDVGVEANIALLRAGFGEDVRRDLPSLNVFNHAIVVLGGEQKLWVDPTDPYARVGDLPGQDQHRLALVIDDDTEALVRTPRTPGAKSTYEQLNVVHLVDSGNGRIVETAKASGFVERLLRANFSGSRKDLQKGLESYAKNTYFSDELVDFSTSPSNDLGKPFELTIKVANAQVAASTLFVADAVISSDGVFSWLPSPLMSGSKRRSDLVLSAPYRATLRYQIHPPDGFVPDALPRMKDVSLGPLKLHRKVQRKGNRVDVTLRLHVDKRRWTPKEVAAFAKAYRRFMSADKPFVRFLQEGFKHRQQQHPKLEIATNRKLARKYAKSGKHRMRLAASLSDLGYGTSARKVAAEAVALEPANAALYSVQGDILSRDLLGRSYAKGYDRDGARKAFRQAAELNPDDIGSQLHLANLFEYNLDGQRYGPGSELDKAVAAYDAIDEDKLRVHEDGTFVHNALYALLWAGRYQEVNKRLRDIDPGQTPAAVAVSAAAAERGPNAGLAEVMRLNLTGPSRNSVLDSAASTLLSMRKYPEAAALTEALAASTSDAATKARAKLQKRIKKIDVMKLPRKTAGQAAVRVVTLMGAHPGRAKDMLDELFAKRALSKNEAAITREVLGSSASAARRLDMEPEVLADIVVATFKTDVKGNAAAGYRVELRSDLNNAKQVLFMVREGGEYRVRALPTMRAALGCEALHLMAKGKRKPAEQWLRWAQPLVPEAGGNDPLRLTPFTRLWKDGKGDAKLAAAALCATGPDAEKTIAPLDKARQAATDAEQQHILDQALADAYAGIDEKKRVEVAKRLFEALPDSVVARNLFHRALNAAGRFQELKAHVAKLSKQKPDDPYLKHARIDAEESLGRLSHAQRLAEALAAKGEGTSGLYNQLAWRSLFIGKVGEKQVGHALRAVQMGGAGDMASLHTLGCVYADAGRVYDARQTFNKLLEGRPLAQPFSIDHYIVGRIAEHLDLPDEAKAAYQRVVERKGALSTYKLAQRRLKALR